MAYQGIYGTFPFTVSDSEVATFRDLAISRSATYAEHKNLAGKPKLQYVGNELDEVTLSILVVPITGYSTVNARLLVLQTMAAAGTPWPLVIGLKYYGLFVLPEYKISHHQIHYGVSLAASVDLTLREYN